MFSTEASKSILLNPRNPHADVCKNLKLNIDDSSNGKYYLCPKCSKRSHYPNARCCRGIVNIEKFKEFRYADGFIKSGMMFVITDDLRVLPASPSSLLQLLQDLGFVDISRIEYISIDVGLEESTNKILGLEVGEDFLDFLFSFCTIPLGSVIKLLDGKSELGCIDNLYKSVESLDSHCFDIPKDEVINGGVAKQYKCNIQPLRILESNMDDFLLDPRNPSGNGDLFGLPFFIVLLKPAGANSIEEALPRVLKRGLKEEGLFMVAGYNILSFSATLLLGVWSPEEEIFFDSLFNSPGSERGKP
ncbi:unnamed protein product [Fraxinus pennsylvanica]|uniref:Uncharacterized protein n=1 Tax=Fraxinus pennsylvanica TaxID=56036 RepID=A0AAD1Z288_9LAMI|nr:unnamed protein product [Fraxinus pennsylvanica]